MTTQSAPTLPCPIHMLSDARGIYIPRDFADVAADGWGLTDEQREDLSNPESEHYWDTWTEVLDNCTCVDSKGQMWSLYQDGDLWAIPTDATEHYWETFFGNQLQ